MSTPKLPIGDGDVPDKALEELLAAFGASEPDLGRDIDLDDPSIDQLLGLTPTGSSPDSAHGPPAEPTVDSPPPDTPPESPVTEPVQQVDPVDPVEIIAPAARAPIKIGGDDELPDPVYLDEEGEERLRGTSGRATEASVREERNTIFIGGDEIEGSSGGIPIGTGPSSMDPRLRARRIAVKRAVGRRRLKWFVIIGVIVVIVVGALATLGSSLFDVQRDKIAVSGRVRMDQSDLDAVIDQLADHPVLLVDTHALETQLERSPWVADARVATDFPHGASIEIRERVPLATYVGTDNRWRIIDVEGRVVDVLKGQPVEFMQITGSAINAEAGDSVGPSFTRAAELVEALSPAVRSRTSSVGVSDNGELSLTFHSDTTITLGAPTDLLEKLTRLEALLKNSQVDGCTSIDVSTQEIGRLCPPAST